MAVVVLKLRKVWRGLLLEFEEFRIGSGSVASCRGHQLLKSEAEIYVEL